MEIDANDVINNLTIKIANLTQELAIAEAQASALQKKIEEAEEK